MDSISYLRDWILKFECGFQIALPPGKWRKGFQSFHKDLADHKHQEMNKASIVIQASCLHNKLIGNLALPTQKFLSYKALSNEERDGEVGEERWWPN